MTAQLIWSTVPTKKPEPPGCDQGRCPFQYSGERHYEKHAVLHRDCRLSTVPRGDMAFLDAAGMCLTLVERDPPINPHLRAHGVEITFEEDRQGGVLNGPAPIFTIPTARCWSLSI
jgi:hypothetical protein